MIIRKCKIVKHGLLRLPEDGDYTEPVKVIGCYFDYQFTLQRHVNFVCLNSFYYLHKVWSIRDQVKTSVLIELIRVLVLSRADYCNSLLLTFISKTSANNEHCRAFDFSIVTFNAILVVPEAATLVAN